MRGIDGINTSSVPCVNGINNFSLDQYQHRDNSRAKRKASAWGNGDFASVLRQNMNKYCTDYSTEVPQGIHLPEGNRTELYEAHTQSGTHQSIEPKPKFERTPKPEHLPGAKHHVGYRQRKIELSEIGLRIDRLLCKNNTNIRRVSRLLGMKPDTFMNAMRPDSRCKEETFQAIADYFEVTLDYLING